MIKLIANIVKVILFFLGLWKEKDAKKAKQKADIGKKITEAFQEVDPKIRASRLNAVVSDIDRV